MWKLLLALGLSFFAASAHANYCRVTVQIEGEDFEVSRGLDDTGAFNYQIVDSRVTSDATAQYYYAHVPGSGRSVAPRLDMDFKKQGRKKFKTGTRLVFKSDSGKEVTMQRMYEERWLDDFELFPRQLLNDFEGDQVLTFELREPGSKKGQMKTVVTGKFDLNRLRAETIALEEADQKLDAVQTNPVGSCSLQDDAVMVEVKD